MSIALDGAIDMMIVVNSLSHKKGKNMSGSYKKYAHFNRFNMHGNKAQINKTYKPLDLPM